MDQLVCSKAWTTCLTPSAWAGLRDSGGGRGRRDRPDTAPSADTLTRCPTHCCVSFSGTWLVTTGVPKNVHTLPLLTAVK